MAGSIDIRVLGPLAVENGGLAIELGPPKQRAVFAVLLLNANSIVPTERIIDEVWGEEAPKTAAHSVQIYVSELRKALDRSQVTVETRSPGYLLRADPRTVDALRFEELIQSGLVEEEPEDAEAFLRDGMRLWRGNPLADFTYDEFAQPRIRQLHELHSRAAEELAELSLCSGDPHSAMQWLDHIEVGYARERAQRIRMLALYREGRQLEALRSFDSYRHAVAEAGLEPSDELLKLEDMIIRRDPALDLRREATRGSNPYRGLSAFKEEDRERMFGRDTLIGELTRRLLSGDALIAVVGPSGSGKSSVVRAGVIPELEGWSVSFMTPGEDPLDRLGRVKEGGRGRRLLVIDQFEEAFTLCDREESDAFLDRLARLGGEGTQLLLSLRADHMDAPLCHAAFSKPFATGVVPVIPMSVSELRDAISQPARSAGVDMETGLVERMIADMEHQPGALPLMQFTLTELYEASQGPMMTLAGYDRLGGIKGALARRADDIHDSLGLADRRMLRRLLLSLTHVTDARVGRRQVPVEDLVHAEGADVSRLIDSLTEHRLLTRDRDPTTGKATVDIAHEALLHEWQRLRGWIATYRADLDRREALKLHAQEWAEAGKDPAYLLGGRALAVYQEWARTAELPVANQERSFLAESSRRQADIDAQRQARIEAARKERRRARLRLIGIGALVAAIAAIGTYRFRASIAGVIDPPPDVVLVTQGVPFELEDGSYNEAAVGGFHRGTDELGLDGEIWSPGYTQRNSDVELAIKRGIGLIIISGEPHVTPELTAQASSQFIEWDIYPDTPAPNVTYFNFKEQEGSFLVGAAAALKTQTGVIGFIGGVDWDVIGRFEAGYTAGARAVNPDIEILTTHLTEWYDPSGFLSPSRAKAEATAMYTTGADVIFHAAGFSGVGLFDAAAEQSDVLGRHLWAIGVDSDQYHAIDGVEELGPWQPETWKHHILTSMLKRIDVVVETSLADYRAGTLEPGVRILGLAEGGVDYSRSGGFIEDIIGQLEAFRRDIISGVIVVPDVLDGRSYALGDEDTR